jgi:hypothetical protein
MIGSKLFCCFLTFAVTIHIVATRECAMYLSPSKVPNAGRGIFAGRQIAKEALLEDCISLQVPRETSLGTQFINYVYGTSSDLYDMIIIGPSSIYNHHNDRNVYYTWSSSDVGDPSVITVPFANMTQTTFRAQENIEVGQEMFNYYGEDWFQRFGSDHGTRSSTKADIPNKTEVAELERTGHCLSDVHVRAATVADTGKGLFASRRFERGEVVAVSPVLALHRRVIERVRNNSLLENYCYGVEGSDLLLFPINYGALMNHASSPNVALGWYEWPTAEAADLSVPSLNQTLRMSVAGLTDAHFAQLDFAYTATRPILEGEELFLDYGAAWQEAWGDYTAALQRWEAASQGSGDPGALTKPLFRQTIDVPAGMYAPQWMDQVTQLCAVGEDGYANYD